MSDPNATDTPVPDPHRIKARGSEIEDSRPARRKRSVKAKSNPPNAARLLRQAVRSFVTMRSRLEAIGPDSVRIHLRELENMQGELVDLDTGLTGALQNVR